MKELQDLWARADQIPVTLVLALAYLTMAVLTKSLGVNWGSSEALAAWGSLTAFRAAGGEPWRLLSHAVLHVNLIHLVFNLSFLVSIGPSLERSMGSVRFAALYVVAAVGGGLGVCLLYDPMQPVVGGSGALFGMMGALVAWNMRMGRHLFAFLDFEGPRRLLGMIAANLVIGMVIPFVSNTAHVGGLVAGFVVTFLFLVPARERSPVRRHWQVAAAALMASLAFASVVPVTRWDWLWNTAVVTTDERRMRSLQRAAAMSFYHLPAADADDVMRLHAELFPPEDEATGKPRRGG